MISLVVAFGVFKTTFLPVDVFFVADTVSTSVSSYLYIPNYLMITFLISLT